MIVLEFISAKLWFWLVIAIALAATTIAGFLLCVVKDLHGKIEILFKAPWVVCLMAWFIFVVAALLRAWGV